VAVCLHLFYPELWPLLHAQLRLIPEPWDLFVTVPHFAATPAWQQIAADQPRVRFVPLPNRGRDVAPWLHLLRSGALDGYDAVCKLHGKRSPHMQGGDAWRDALWQALVGDGANVAAIVARFRADPALGLLGPAASWRLLADAAGWAKNKHNVDLLAKRQGLAAPAPGQRFFAGTMFWFRPAALAAWRESPAADEFPLEMGQTEGTLAHAVERCIALGLDGLPWRVQPWPSSPTDT
jgi:lipopolysaccharide biosynthesis protein